MWTQIKTAYRDSLEHHTDREHYPTGHVHSSTTRVGMCLARTMIIFPRGGSGIRQGGPRPASRGGYFHLAKTGKPALTHSSNNTRPTTPRRTTR